MSDPVGALSWISEFVVRARVFGPIAMADEVVVGDDRLTGEVIGLSADEATIQLYEDTAGLKPGADVYSRGRPLSVTLGPGLIGSIYDGIQRPLDVLQQQSGIFVERGATAPPLSPDRTWHVEARGEEGRRVSPGDVFAVVQETPIIEHRLLVPPGIAGELCHLAEPGEYTVTDTIAVVRAKNGQEHALTMTQRWHVRVPRPIAERLAPEVPLVTGQRVLDTLFPLAKGGPAAIPGGFGTGKTVLQHALAQWADADIIIYIGCGERGNEMAEVLEEFPELEDPRTGQPLMNRTLLIANTSNMPVAARESSIYTGVTIAEYYRDQGYDVAVMADSTSRWAQALREIAGRLGEMPIEQGYPAYLPSRLSAFYERAGRVTALGDREGSVTLIGAVSPPGGDFSEPVTRHTQRFTRCWWALSRDLAHKRHYPAVDWLQSYSLQADSVSGWWAERSGGAWRDLRARTLEILQRESSLQQIVQLVGPSALSDEQQWLLFGARLLREGFLQQNALNPTDAYASPEKQLILLRMFLRIHERGLELLDQGADLDDLTGRVPLAQLIRLKDQVSNEELERLGRCRDDVLERLDELETAPERAAESRDERR